MSNVAIKTDPMTDFQEKLQARVREDIRELLPQDAVNELVKRAVEDVFFKPRKVPDPRRSNWSLDVIDGPSWFVEEVTKAAAPIIKQAVVDCVANNHAAVQKVIDEYIDANKLTIVTTKHLNELLSGAIYQLGERLSRQH